MSCCCTKIYKFCKKISACNPQNIAALFKGIADGSYVIELNFLNSIIKIQMVVVGIEFTVTAPTPLNENFDYIGRVFNSAGQMVPFVVDSVQYDCFQFQTITIAGTGDTDASDSAPSTIIIENEWDAVQW